MGRRIEIQEFAKLPKSFQDEIMKDYIQIFPIQENINGEDSL